MGLNYPEIDSSILSFEGFGSSLAPSITSGNNPGAIMYSPWSASQGATGMNSNGTAIFPDFSTGMAALDNLVTQKIQGGINTPAALAESWAPSNAPGNSAAGTANYAASIARGLGIGTGDTIPAAATPAIGAAATPAIGAAATGSATGQSGSWVPGSLWDWIGYDPWENIPAYKSGKDATGSAVGTATAAASWWAGLSLTQIVILLLGLILLIAGLFSLRPVQQATTTVVRTARRGAALFA